MSMTQEERKAVEEGTDWKVLQELAEISPPEYADQIRRRNEKLLEGLDQIFDLPDEKLDEKNRRHIGEIGCPHCHHGKGPKIFDCDNCLWNTAISSSITMACIYTRFGGYVLGELSCLIYASGFEEVHRSQIWYDEENYHKTRTFLLAHIEWTNRFEWGKRYADPATAVIEGDLSHRRRSN